VHDGPLPGLLALRDRVRRHGQLRERQNLRQRHDHREGRRVRLRDGRGDAARLVAVARPRARRRRARAPAAEALVTGARRAARPALRAALALAALGAAALAVGGCRARSLTFTVGGEVSDGGTHPAFDAIVIPDVAPHETATHPDAEGTDVGSPDAPDGCGANLDTDPANCGACGHVCHFAGATPTCAAGVCGIDKCLPGFSDLDGVATNGCEYGCIVTNNGVEVCDNVDNDCNGKIDETTNKDTDLENCGACGHRCAFLNAAASCTAGACVRGACADGFVDANKLDSDGCECGQTNGGVEICDGIDNDCNGLVDDVPAAGFMTDPQHCGACNHNCTTLPNASGACVAAACVVTSCQFGHADANKDPSDGCELACPGGFVGGVEVCDGVDNDCDGKIDADDDSLVGVDNFCAQRGECAGSKPVCQGGGWVCNYGPTVELTAPNTIIGNETRCDGKDNDCDGCIDESFPEVGLQPAAAGASCAATTASACHDSGVGLCQGQGHFVCNAQGTGTTCSITTPGAAPAAEVCDGQDNDCDGVVDNGGASDPARVKEPMVAISGGGLASTVWIYAYEAARPDATAGASGVSVARACAKAGALPWTNLTHAEAAAACQAAGKRLCTEAEWQRACQTASATACTWSYASACTTISSTTCNTHELDGDPTMSGDQDVLLATGAMASCYADWGAGGHVFDMTGNAKEWTAARSAGVNPLRGGSYDDLLAGSTCSFSFVAVGESYKLANAGFRCCSDTAP
jgi:hypothetical protein